MKPVIENRRTELIELLETHLLDGTGEPLGRERAVEWVDSFVKDAAFLEGLSGTYNKLMSAAREMDAQVNAGGFPDNDHIPYFYRVLKESFDDGAAASQSRERVYREALESAEKTIGHFKHGGVSGASIEFALMKIRAALTNNKLDEEKE